jgi:hypothetical protein
MQQSSVPTRDVEHNVLTSSDLPRIKLRIDPSLRFVGRLQFVLYDVAEADVFVFAEGGAGGALRRFEIVQFEGYLDNNAYAYDYHSPTTVQVGAHPFLHDYYFTDRDRQSEPLRPDSDAARVWNLLREHGFTQPARYMRVRLVRLLGEERRRELLIIYGESLDDRPDVAGELPANAFFGEEHSQLAGELLGRALRAIEVLEY